MVPPDVFHLSDVDGQQGFFFNETFQDMHQQRLTLSLGGETLRYFHNRIAGTGSILTARGECG